MPSSGSPTDLVTAASPSSRPARQLRYAGFGAPHRNGDGRREEEREQRVRHEQVLELNLVCVIQRRHRGEGCDPKRDLEAVHEQRVDHDADAKPHQVL